VEISLSFGPHPCHLTPLPPTEPAAHRADVGVGVGVGPPKPTKASTVDCAVFVLDVCTLLRSCVQTDEQQLHVHLRLSSCCCFLGCLFICSNCILQYPASTLPQSYPYNGRPSAAAATATATTAIRLRCIVCLHPIRKRLLTCLISQYFSHVSFSSHMRAP
jgi:hypothetical protein